MFYRYHCRHCVVLIKKAFCRGQIQRLKRYFFFTIWTTCQTIQGEFLKINYAQIIGFTDMQSTQLYQNSFITKKKN